MNGNGNGATVATRQPRSIALHEWDAEFARLVKTTVLKPRNRDATNAELALLAEQAVRTGLDPMARQIYGIYRFDSRANAEVMTIQVGIDGFRAIAERTGRYAGGPAHLYCGSDKQWTDVWSGDNVPVAAKATVRKVVGGVLVDTEAIALWREYVATDRNGKPMGLWKDKPAVMIGKCAEALALRKAFPNDLSGLYIEEELDGPGAPEPVAQTTLPAAADTTAEEETEQAAVTSKRAKELVDIAFGFDLGDKFPRAIAHITGSDPGDCSTKKAATEAVRALTVDEADKLDEWLQRKADEAAARDEEQAHA